MISGSSMEYLLRHSGSLATGKTELVSGQIVKGRVMQILPEGQALLQIGGVKVLAQLEAPLQAGERIWFQVQAAGQPIQLKAISRTDKTTSKNNSQEGDFASLAKSLGFEQSPEHKELLTRLINARLPLTKNLIPAYISALKEMGGDRQSIDIILLAAGRGLPLSKDNLQGIKAFFNGARWVEMVDELSRELAQVFTHATLSDHPDLNKTFTMLQQQLALIQEVDPKSADSIRTCLMEIFKGLGLLDRQLDTGDAGFTPILQDLKKILSLHSDSESLRNKLEGILQFVHGQQLMASSSEHVLQQLVLHIPLPGFRNHSFLQLEGKKRENGEIDPDHCRLLFCLEMTSLGDIMLDVRIVNRIVSIEIVGHQQDQLVLFSKFKEELVSGLKNLGFQLSALKISETSHEGERENSLPKGMALPYQGVDLRI